MGITLSRRRLLAGFTAAGAGLGMAKESRVKRIFVTGSTEGLGLAAARTLMDEGHEVVFHARSQKRAEAIAEWVPRAAGLAIGDLSSAGETRSIAEQVNKIGRMDAVIHNAGVYLMGERGNTPEGHATVLAVNVLAPYILTALMDRPDRLVYLSSGMHRGGSASLRDVDWRERPWEASTAYSESKLYLTAFAFAIARRWPAVLSSVVDPGWVPTRMGGAGAPDDLTQGHLTQTWLAVGEDPAARVSGKYWYHHSQQQAAAAALDPGFQDRVVGMLGEVTARVI